MNRGKVNDPAAVSRVPKWTIEWWGLLRGLVLLFSAFAGVTALYYVILSVFRG